MGGSFRAAVTAVGAAFFPHACVACGAEGALVCGTCDEERFGPLKGIFSCPGCGKRVVGFGRCGARACGGAVSEGMVSVGQYGDPALRELLHAWKYERVPEAGELIQDLCWRTGRRHKEAFAGLGEAAVVSVPIHPFREALRGFDQTRALGEAFAAGAGLPYEAGVLEARFRWRTQVGVSDPDARRRNAEASVRVSGAAPRSVVLVDDVVTTGATLAACAGALRAAGAAQVVAATFLRG